ncbi:hypothetical protein D9758_008301 [Tetrapyrgos nigripes]|uniref:Uncharacterized protein n=1 Tax=Tetrapyrgos nigripes TaxID=182062 RepID=A0A8H5G1F0_9AGAR|nr:hypothetical protein D9758_008301 [Tetrapyrgos nigripes]
MPKLLSHFVQQEAMPPVVFLALCREEDITNGAAIGADGWAGCTPPATTFKSLLDYETSNTQPVGSNP